METFDWLAKQADLHGDKVALVDVASGRERSYTALNERAGRFAGFLRHHLGLNAGERVAILAPNSSDYVEILYGCAKAELILVPLNWRLAAAELDTILADCTPSVLVIDPRFAATAGALGYRFGHPVISLGDGAVAGPAYEQTLDLAPRQVDMRPRPGNDIWSILYTSGTTGRPKGVLQTFDMVLYNMLNIGLPVGLNHGDTTLNLLPFFHTGGLNLFLNPTLIVGGTALIQPGFEPEATLRLLAERTTVFFGVPAVYLFLSQHSDFDRTDLSAVRSWSCGGAPMPVSLLHRYAERGITIRQGFGMTETGPTVFLIDEANALAKAGSVGKPQLFAEVRIVDPQGEEVLPGEAGELLVRGPAVTPGYWQRPEQTAESLHGGWLHTGDVARCDEDGYYAIIDRLKDMYISGGENVYPAEVENVLYAHPAIAEAAVVGVPDERWGEVGWAVVVLKADATLAAQELIGFCRERLAGYKVPKHVVFTGALPRNAAGKVVKAELRREARA